MAYLGWPSATDRGLADVAPAGEHLALLGAAALPHPRPDRPAPDRAELGFFESLYATASTRSAIAISP